VARNSDNRAGPLRLLALIAVAAGLAALTAAACALSYSSIVHLATAAGISSRLVRVYPLILDALLVMAGCSVLALRGAGLPSRVYAWLCLLVLLGGLAGGGAVHAAAVKISRRTAGIVAAVVPWAIVLIGFGLLLALLRYARNRRPGPAPDQRTDESDSQAEAEATAAPRVTVIMDTAAAPEPSLAPPAMTGLAGSPGPQTVPQRTIPIPLTQPGVAARLADMQLRARIPRQSAEQAPADPVAAQPAPFMPPVGPPPAAPAQAQDQDQNREEQTNPRLVQDQQAAQGAQGAQAAPEPAADETGPASASNLNPAPVAEGNDPGEPPALRRPHSTPTPPED
jgi:hypothetical protein